jgi:hypothetical protein
MSNFLFKGVPLNDVIDTTGTTNATGYNFKYRSTTIANSKPLPTSYLVKGVDIANNAAARVATIISSTTSYNVPTGVKSIRYMMCGGGGAGGSGGGERFSDGGNAPSSSAGGAGGSGGRGAFSYGTINTFNNQLNITIGAGGPAQGTVGVATNGDNNNTGQPRSDGSKGPDGGSTIIVFNSTPGSGTVTAVGGGGGNGGLSGNTNSPDIGRQNAGAAGNANTAYVSNAEWENTILTQYGNAGGGGHGGGNQPGGAGGAGGAGNAGGVQLIWLYN